MKLVNRVQKKRLLFRFMISYIIILSIPLLVTILVYQQSASIVKKDALEANLSLLEQSKYIIDKGLNQVNSLFIDLTLDTKLKMMLYKKGDMSGSDVNTVYELWRDLPSKAKNGDLVSNYFIILPEIDRVINSESSYNLKDFYSSIVSYEDMTFEEWKQLFIMQYHRRQILPAVNVVMNNNLKKSVITCLQSMPVEGYKKPLGVMMILIDKEELIKSLEKVNVRGGGNVSIVDADGKVIASKNGNMEVENVQDFIASKTAGYRERKVNGRDMLYSYTTSSFYGWTYVAELPSHVVLERVNYIRNITVIAIVLCLIIVMIAAYFLSYKNIKPIKDIIKILSTRISGIYSEELEDYNYLRSAVSRLVENDIELSRMVEQNLPLAQTVFLQRLIRGELISQEELDTNMQQVGIDLKGKNYNILIVHIRGYFGIISKETLHELNVIKEMVRNFVWGTEISGYAVDIDESSFAFIMTYQHSSDEECKHILEKSIREMIETVTGQYGIKLDFASGSYYRNIAEIYYSLGEARYALEYGNPSSDNEIVWYTDISHSNEWIYYFPIDIEQRIIHLLKAGNREEIEKILDVIYRENFINNKISCDMAKNLYNEMRGTIYKALRQVSVTDRSEMFHIYDLMQELKHSNKVSETHELMKKTFLYMCDTVHHAKRSQNKKLMDEIVGFIVQNFTRSEMCLAFVAQAFDLSEVYLSSFFKEQMGQNFTEYVEKLRISTACDLLTRSKLSIEDIAAKVGYNSPHVFRRAFKKCKGVLPTDLRKTK